jgi:DNA end-binding protein Ku
MRPLWKGAISFGLVNIPVGLYSATKPASAIKFHMLRDADLSPIHYKRVAEADGKEVDWNHIVKGYEYEKDKYVVLTDEDFERVEIKSNQMVDIREFVSLAEIDPQFFDEPYLLAPEKSGAKAYNLLREALEKSGKVGIAKVVIRPPREHLAAVKPLDGVLTLELMHFPDELRDPAELEVPHPTAGQKELDMALSLVKSMADRWQPQKYHDEYKDALLKLIEQKIKARGKSLPRLKSARQPASGKIVDLVSILQESLQQAQKGHQTHKSQARSTRKKAA